VHGSGFLAAFAAGLTITALDVELCDCFLEYGETTSEMLLLFTFVLFGGSLIWSGLSLLSVATVAFALIALFARLPIYSLALARARIDGKSRFLIAWFGPSGLSSLLLVLVAVFAATPGSQLLFELCCLVVLFSVVLHGGSPLVLDRLKVRRARASGGPPLAVGQAVAAMPVALPAVASLATAAPDEREAGEAGPGEEADETPDRIALADLVALQARGEPVVILDVRTDRSYDGSEVAIAGGVRMPPDHVAERATELGVPRRAWVIPYCT
jgi:sodium/hydrogen antiporter